MNQGIFRRLVCAGIALGMVALPASLQACAACFGRSDDAMAQGMNLGIFALLVVIISVLIGIASFFIFLARRSVRFSAAAAGPASNTASAPEPSSRISQTTP